MMHFIHLYWIPLLFFVVGLLLWLVPRNSPQLSEFGKITMAAGIFVACLTFTQHKIFP